MMIGSVFYFMLLFSFYVQQYVVRMSYFLLDDLMYTVRSQQFEVYRYMYLGVIFRFYFESRFVDIRFEVMDFSMYKFWFLEFFLQFYYEGFAVNGIFKFLDMRYMFLYIFYLLEGYYFFFVVLRMFESYYVTVFLLQFLDGRFMFFQVFRSFDVFNVYSFGDVGKYF